MKKIYLFLIAVSGVLTAVSCAKELVDNSAQVNPGEVTTLTLSFDKTSKTELIEGKTTWMEGDVIRIYNSSGEFYEDVVVPAEDEGKSDIQVNVNIGDKKYFAVYPVEAANGVSSEKVSVILSSNPDGRFASANICAAETPLNGKELRMRNVTAIFTINVESNNTVEIVQVNAQNAMTGTYSVDLSGENPVLEATSATKSATIVPGAVDGKYYIAVAPGTYAEAFSVTALKGNGGYQTLTSTKANEIAVNTINDLGKIGDKLSTGLPGEGTEASPYMISNIGEYTAFSASVSLGNSFDGKYLKLNNDLEDVTCIVGNSSYGFKGAFDGNGKTLSLNIDKEGEAASNVAAFALLEDGAEVHDLKIAGKVKAEGENVGGLAAVSKGNVALTMCSTSATVEGGDKTGGIVGWVNGSTSIVNCSNSGQVSASGSVGGIVGYMYTGTVENAVNTGVVKGLTPCGGIWKFNAYNNHHWVNLESGETTNLNGSVKGVGGILGYGQNTVVTNCQNNAEISGVSKVGGIGGSFYGGTLKDNRNIGNIVASGKIAGGIAGWVYTYINSTNDSNTANVSAVALVGGLYGMLNLVGYSSSNAVSNITGCVNSGAVTSTGKYTIASAGDTMTDYSMAGGLVGLFAPNSLATNRRGIGHILKCKNTGDVTGPGYAVGGLVGLAWSFYNYSTQSDIINSTNTGNVSGFARIGGIIGEQFARWIGHNKIVYTNLLNSGSVTSTNTATASAGGIIGRSYYHSTSTTIEAGTYGAIITNCLNTGDIMYPVATHVSPYIGGIVGFTSEGSCKNVVNLGKVGPVSGEPVEEANQYLGYIAGQLSNTYHPMNFVYSVEGIAGQAAGTTSKSEITNATTFDGEGALADIITIQAKDYTEIIDALNAWVGTSTTYYKWRAGAKGPEFDIN